MNHPRKWRRSVLQASLLLLPSFGLAQTPGGVLAANTPLAVQLHNHFPLRKGQPIQAQLLYPLYVSDTLVLPSGALVRGSVIDLRPDHDRRVHALLGGDFTPLRSPVVNFNQIVLADGSTLPFNAGPAADGAPVFRAVAPPTAQGGFLHRQFTALLTVARSDLAIFLGPGKADRLLQFVYNQLPYHPQRIENGTAWTIETSASLIVPAQPAPPSPPAVAARQLHFWEPHPPALNPASHEGGTWMIEANLTQPLSSESSSTGQAITATVSEPIFNHDHTVAVPQGATLTGSVTRARPARSFHRTGVLSFSFNKLQLPNTEVQNVETRLAGADSAQAVALNSEGLVKSAPEDRLSLPIFLALLASSPLDHDHGDHEQIRKNAVGGAAGLGLVGTIIGLSGASANAVAGIGYYGAARAFYERWIAHGQKIAFPRDTHIVVETTARRSAPIKP